MNGGPGNELEGQRAKQFPHLGSYTLTPGTSHNILTANWFHSTTDVGKQVALTICTQRNSMIKHVHSCATYSEVQ